MEDNGSTVQEFYGVFMENKRDSRRSFRCHLHGEQGHSTETNGIHGAPPSIEEGIKQPVGYLIPFFVLSETRCKDSAFLEYMQIKV